MFKRFTTFLLLALLLFVGTNVGVSAKTFQMTNLENPEYRTFDGTTNVERFVNMKFHDNEDRNQRFNVLEFDNSDENIHLITISDYVNFKWGMTPLEGMINTFETKYPHLEVLGGVNGDFYDINDTGHPIGTYVEDYEVIKGSPTRNSFNIRSDRTFDIAKPVKDGHEIVVVDENNEIKFREKITRFNKSITKDSQIGVLFNDYEGEINEELDLIKVSALDIKYSGKTFERAKGSITDTKLSEISEKEFIIYAKDLKDKLESTDTILVQHKLKNYENVRGTMGGGDLLVDNGDIGSTVDGLTGFLQRAPRTAIGIKEDGSPFFIVTNGRDETEGVTGTTLEETAYLMREYGAVNALNIDGGGSSTMMAKDTDGKYHVLNKMSDGRMRSISNGILIVRGDIKEQPIHIKGEDLRDEFESPQNLYVDSNNNVRFDKVDDATRYIITVDDKTYETSSNSFSLESLSPGDYEIKVRVKSNLNGKASKNTDTINFKVKERTTNEILDFLKGFSKNNN